MERNIIKLADIVREIGDSSAQPYSYDLYKQGGDYFAEWESETGDRMGVALQLIEDRWWSREEELLVAMWMISFGIMKGLDPLSADTEIIRNDGDLYRTMATLIKALKEHYNKTKNSDKATVYYFSPNSKEDKTGREDNGKGRERLYKAYISRDPDIRKNFFITDHPSGRGLLVVEKEYKDHPAVKNLLY